MWSLLVSRNQDDGDHKAEMEAVRRICDNSKGNNPNAWNLEPQLNKINPNLYLETGRGQNHKAASKANNFKREAGKVKVCKTVQKVKQKHINSNSGNSKRNCWEHTER